MSRIELALILSVVCTSAAPAQSPPEVPRSYDGIQAGVDAFRMGEEKRQTAVAEQLGVNDAMRFFNGYPTNRGETIYYGYLSPGLAHAAGYAPLGSLDAVYGYGYRRPWHVHPLGNVAPSVFEPWPYVPGDIWGYGAFYQPARQPIGQRQEQTGQNRWESHPVYAPPVAHHRPFPPVHSPLLDRTPYASPQEPIAPAPSQREDKIPPPPPQASAPQGAVPPGPVVPAPPRRRREY